MNKEELVNEFEAKLRAAGINDLTKKTVRVAVDCFTEALASGLAKDQLVQITNFGSLRAKKMAAKPGHNPRTSEPIQIPARVQVFFSAGKGLREGLNNPGKKPAAAAPKGKLTTKTPAKAPAKAPAKKK
jgi:DNA-binding protein HU-beta